MFPKMRLPPPPPPPSLTVMPGSLKYIDAERFNELCDEAFRRLAEGKINPPLYDNEPKPKAEPDWRSECFELIAILRDETQSRSVHERCCTLLKKISETRR